MNQQQTTPKELQIPSCPHCGSVDLSFDTFTEWDLAKQTIVHEYDQSHCNKCGQIGDYKLIPYKD